MTTYNYLRQRYFRACQTIHVADGTIVNMDVRNDMEINYSVRYSGWDRMELFDALRIVEDWDAEKYSVVSPLKDSN